MKIFSPNGTEIVFEADTLEDAIELQNLADGLANDVANRAGIRLETRRNQFFRAFIPVRSPGDPQWRTPIFKPTQRAFEDWFNAWASDKPEAHNPEIRDFVRMGWNAALAFVPFPK